MFPIDEDTGLAFSNSAGAVTVALDRIYKDNILPAGTNFTLVWRFGECDRVKAAGLAFELVREERVDVIFAPPCMEAGLVVGHVATFYNIPVILWGYCFSSAFADTDLYPTAISSVPTYGE
ncbi:guanylyl cyclase [Aphelenchoides avenae]|nr:guanylyl cyclase [Aphelenchus avenae]